MRTGIAALVLFLALPASASDPNVTGLTKRAAELEAALATANAANDRNAQVESAFQLARTYEQWAAAEPAKRKELLVQALETYALLWAEPGRRDAEAAARNNCAQIYVALGDDAKAAELFKSAAAIPDSLQPFYLANYAAFLASRGDAKGAIAHYERALRLQPDDAVTEEKLLALYEGMQAGDHLWRLIDRNALQRAQSLALDHLGREHAADVKRDLLAVVAVTLARQRIPREAFAESEVSARLAKITDPAVRSGIAELRRLFAGSLDIEYAWWRTPGARREPPAMDAQLAFSALARELGEQARQTSAEQAERYLTLAVEVSDGRDPEPAAALAELYYAGKRTADLERFVRQYQGRFFDEKANAYRSGDWKKIYRFHVSLGTIFARLGWTGDEWNPRSAIFQLERARMAARKLDAQSGTKVVLDPRSVELLAQSYRKAEPETNKDLKLRLESAEEYAKAGRTTSAQRVLQPVAADPRLQEQGEDRIRFDRLKLQVPVKVDTNDVQIERTPKLTTGGAVRAVERTAPGLSVTVTGLEGPTATRLQMLLAEYYSTPVAQRSDQKLRELGVKKINPPVRGKGSVEMQSGTRVVTVQFETSQR